MENKEFNFADMIRQAEAKTHVEAPKNLNSALQAKNKVEKIDTGGKPTLEKLKALFPDYTQSIDRARHCIKYAESKKMNFIGFSLLDGEPMFKKKEN